MAADLGLALFEELLYLIGAFVGFSVAYVGYQGYKETSSPTLLRLALAFALLGCSFTLSGLSGLAGLGMLPTATFILWALLISAASFETLGYFFLAFSHMIDVRSSMKLGLGSALALPSALTIATVMKSLSLYFILYGVVETTISYTKVKKRETLLIAVGLALIALGEFTRWASYFYLETPPMVIASLTLKITGIFSLYLPVVKFSLAGGVK